jgi:hypothetical protein
MSDFVKFSPEHERILNQMLDKVPAAKAGKMFGMPAYKVKGKLAVGLTHTGIVAKVGAKRAQELIGKAGITTFEPMQGRVWKDWVLLNDHFEAHRAIFEEAVQYVLTENA